MLWMFAEEEDIDFKKIQILLKGLKVALESQRNPITFHISNSLINWACPNNMGKIEYRVCCFSPLSFFICVPTIVVIVLILWEVTFW